ncbi:MAG: PH domain-containing protein [Phycisphaerales bacterium]|nr:PH domain-containing protein [Phycisphaerales bacterium]
MPIRLIAGLSSGEPEFVSSDPSPLEQSIPSEAPVADEVLAVPTVDDVRAVWLTDESKQTLHPNFVPCERLVGWIVVAVLGTAVIIFTGLWFWFGDPSLIVQTSVGIAVLALLAVLCWSAQYWPPIDYRYRSFHVSVTGIQIRKGVLWRSVMDVPKSRVQHTDVNQGPIERKYGLAHLVIHTAGTISASVKLEGLGHETAVAIRDHLMEADRGDAV